MSDFSSKHLSLGPVSAVDLALLDNIHDENLSLSLLPGDFSVSDSDSVSVSL